MKTLTLLGALAVMAALAGPAAEASDRHRPYSGRRHGYTYRHDGPRYDRHYAPLHRAHYYDRYYRRPYVRYYYDGPYYYDPYYYAPPGVSLHYHGRVPCYRPHVSLFFRW